MRFWVVSLFAALGACQASQQASTPPVVPPSAPAQSPGLTEIPARDGRINIIGSGAEISIVRRLGRSDPSLYHEMLLTSMGAIFLTRSNTASRLQLSADDLLNVMLRTPPTGQTTSQLSPSSPVQTVAGRYGPVRYRLAQSSTIQCFMFAQVFGATSDTALGGSLCEPLAYSLRLEARAIEMLSRITIEQPVRYTNPTDSNIR